MAHKEQGAFVDAIRNFFPEAFHGQNVLEVGSLDINGSIRDRFSSGAYTGIDIAPGPGVDVVCQGQHYDAPDAAFGFVISCEAMEHNPFWQESFANMIRLCRPGGMVLMTCATTGRGEHGTRRSAPEASPLTVDMGWDYYRNLRAGDFRQAFDLAADFSEFAFFTNRTSCDLYFIGCRKGAAAPPGMRRKLAILRRRYIVENSYPVLKSVLRTILPNPVQSRLRRWRGALSH